MTVTKAKQGYKLVKSLFGKFEEIPNDWKMVNVKNATLSHKQGFYTNQSYVNDGIRLVRITDLQNPTMIYDSMPFLELDKKTINDFKVDLGDFLIARSGAIGRYGIAIKDIPCVFGSYIIRFVFDNTILLNEFFGYFFQTNFMKKQLFSIQQGSSNININAENIKSIKIKLPNLSEQQKISFMLSHVDDLIESYDKVILSTKKLKKGLMQKLLTKGIGHTKFKKVKFLFGKEIEIPEDWEVKPVSEIAIVTMGQSPSGESYTTNEGIPLLNGPTEFGPEYPTPIQFTTSPTKLCHENDILLCVRGSTTGRLNLADRKYCIGRGLAAISGLKNKTDTKWLYYQYVKYQKDIYNIASGGGSTFPNINQDLIKKMILPFSKFKEQQKIASILSQIDNGIQHLEQDKSCIKSLKKGLMQKLLTGQIRVKV